MINNISGGNGVSSMWMQKNETSPTRHGMDIEYREHVGVASIIYVPAKIKLG